MIYLQWLLGLTFWGGMLAAAYGEETRRLVCWLRTTGPLWLDTVRTSPAELTVWAQDLRAKVLIIVTRV